MNLGQIRLVNMVLTFVGALVFTSLFFYIMLAPADFDQRTREFAIGKVRGEVDQQLGDIAQSERVDRLSEFAGSISSRLQTRIDEARDSLDSGTDQLIADILAAACKLDCERRDQAAAAVRGVLKSSILRNQAALERLQSLVVGKYDDVMGELRLDLSIFTGSSAVALIFAFLLSVFRGRAAAHLLPISLCLTAATVIAVLWYALGQDWITTILFSSYWGWTYSCFLGGLSLLMLDIAANKARVTSFVMNGISGAFGNLFSFAPC